MIVQLREGLFDALIVLVNLRHVKDLDDGEHVRARELRSEDGEVCRLRRHAAVVPVVASM